MKKPEFVLASRSPRRIELLSAFGFRFRVRPVDVDERVWPNESPLRYARRVSKLKLDSARARSRDRLPIVVADTIVVDGNEILGKPTSVADARRMLKRLMGKSHIVMTIVRIGTEDGIVTFAERSQVQFRTFSDHWLNRLLQSGEWKDKAGGYAAQGASSALIRSIRPSISTVIGFPIERFIEIWGKLRP